MDDPKWVAVIIQFLQFIVVTVAACVAYSQFKVHAHNRQLQVILAVFETLENAEVLQSRAFIHNLSVDADTLTDAEFDQCIQKMRPALIAYHRVGYLVAGKYVRPDPIVGYFWDGVSRSWSKTEGFLERERKRRGYETYMNKFDYLFNISEQYRVKHNLPKP